MKRLQVMACGFLVGLALLLPPHLYADSTCKWLQPNSSFHRITIPRTQFVPGSAEEQTYLDEEMGNGFQLVTVLILPDVTIYYWQCAP